MTEILKQIEELSEKAVKYEHLKGRYTSVANKLREASNIIEEAIKQLDPASTIKTRTSTGRASRGEVVEKLEEQYKKLEMGLTVSLESLHKDYPDMEEKSIAYIFYNKLSNAPKVMKRKENRTTILYIQKNI